MLNFNEDTYFEKIWFLDAIEKHGLDVLAALTRPMKGGDWSFLYRFRYGTPESDPFEDKLSEHEARITGKMPVAEVMSKVEFILGVIALRHTPTTYVLDIQGSGEKAWEILSVQPWCHVKIVKFEGPLGAVKVGKA